MALDFAGSTHQVDCGSGSGLDDKLTLFTWQWLWWDSVTGDQRIWQKSFGATFQYLASNINAGNLEAATSRASGAQGIRALRSNFAHFGTGKWLCIMSQFDGSTSSNNKLWVGDLTNPPAEPSAYITQSAGSGAISSNAASSLIYGQRGGSAANFDGKIAIAGWRSSHPTIGEIYNIWRGGLSADRLGEWHFGMDGASTVVDRSGNGNTGTVTGATVSAHVPILRPYIIQDEDDAYEIKPYTVTRTTAGTSDVVIFQPRSGYTNRAVVVHHGFGGSAESLFDADFESTALALTRAGILVAASDLGGDLWGSDDGQTESAALHALLMGSHSVTKIVVLGLSGGGPGSLLDAAAGIAGLAGWVGIMVACDLEALYLADPVAGVEESIEDAYNIQPDGSDFDTQTAGHDPVTLAASAFTGLRMRFYASPDDTIVPKTAHADVMAALVASTALESEVVVASGEHGDDSHYQPVDLLSFCVRCFAAAFPSTPVLDTFNRSDEGPPPSANWTDGAEGMQVLSNQIAVIADATANASFWTAAAFGPDVEGYITSNANPVTVLFVDVGVNGYAVSLDFSGNEATVLRFDAAVPTTLLTVAVTLGAGDAIGLRRLGSIVELWHKPAAGSWTCLGGAYDITYPSLTGNIGLLATDAAWRGDDFGGGDVVAVVFQAAWARGSNVLIQGFV